MWQEDQEFWVNLSCIARGKSGGVAGDLGLGETKKKRKKEREGRGQNRKEKKEGKKKMNAVRNWLILHSFKAVRRFCEHGMGWVLVLGPQKKRTVHSGVDEFPSLCKYHIGCAIRD